MLCQIRRNFSATIFFRQFSFEFIFLQTSKFAVDEIIRCEKCKKTNEQIGQIDCLSQLIISIFFSVLFVACVFDCGTTLPESVSKHDIAKASEFHEMSLEEKEKSEKRKRKKQRMPQNINTYINAECTGHCATDSEHILSAERKY